MKVGVYGKPRDTATLTVMAGVEALGLHPLLRAVDFFYGEDERFDIVFAVTARTDKIVRFWQTYAGRLFVLNPLTPPGEIAEQVARAIAGEEQASSAEPAPALPPSEELREQRPERPERPPRPPRPERPPRKERVV